MKTRMFLASLFFCAFMMVSGQRPTIRLTFTAENNASYVKLDSIKVMNRSQGGDTLLVYPDTVLVLNYTVGIPVICPETGNFQVFQNYPNPVLERTTINLFVPGKDKVSLTVTDMTGRSIIKTGRVLDKGVHSFSFTAPGDGLYFFTAEWRGMSSTIKILQNASYKSQGASLEYIGTEVSTPRLKASSDIQEFTYALGDTLLFIGYVNILESGMLDSPEENHTYKFQFATNIPCPGTPTVTYEGQVYNTIQIFSQCWLKENLNVGTMIPGTMEQSDNGTIEKYCYNDNPDSCAKYGGLYQWKEMMQYTTQQGVQGICPTGWHLPFHEEWGILEGAVDSHYGIGDPEWDWWGMQGFDASINLKTTSGWEENGNGTDLYGFSGLPAGDRTGGFFNISELGYFWTSTAGNNEDAWNRILIYNEQGIWRDKYYDFYGFSVRCLRTITNSAPIISEMLIDPGSVTSGGVATVTVNAYDPDGDALTYEYTASGGSISGGGPVVIWNAPLESGSYSIHVIVSDENGGTATDSVSVLVTGGVPAENLVAHWLFNGDADDATGNGHNGTPTAGHAWFGGGPAPQLTADRFGNANSCYHFDQGSNIEVPYSTDLNPQALTISAWIKMEEQPNNDYIIALDRWNGWKLNLQEMNFLFFTVKVDYNGNEYYYDRDSNPYDVSSGTWTHVAVTCTDGFINFYINGVLVRSWDNTPGNLANVDNINLSIGSDLPTGQYSLDDTSPYFVGWGGYWKGAIDDLRFYNVALTPSQVATIYNFEVDSVAEK
jgi:uncharacterized protein (TIGR02145 family)